MRKRFAEFLLYSSAEFMRDLHDCVFEIGKHLSVEVVEKIENRFSCTTCTCSCLHYPQLLLFVALTVDLMCSFKVSRNGHTIVWLEYFAWC